MQEHIINFKTHLQTLGYSKSTQQMLPACTAEFLQKSEEKGINEISEIKPEHIKEHYEYLTCRPNKRRQGGLSSMMINHHIYAIRLFFNYLEQIGSITENPISNLTFPKPENKQREILTQEEIKQVYRAAETYKEKSLLGIFYGCGLRRSEGEALNIRDISFKEKLLYVREGKNKKRRAVPMNKQTGEDIKKYLYDERFSQADEPALITNSNGKRIKGNNANNIIKSLVRKTGINKEISLHSLRHSIATHLSENGMPAEYIRDFLGHKNLESTQIYTRISKKQLENL